MVGAVILSVVSFIAGHPTTVVCDATLGGHAAGAPAGALAWTAYGGNTIYASPAMCATAQAAPGSDGFVATLDVFVHEAAHARGIQTEACAELTADLGVYDVLRRFYNIPFFTPSSRKIGAAVLARTRQLPAGYQPEACTVYR